MGEENMTVNPEENQNDTEEVTQEKEQLNAFQKFMKTLMGEKDEAAKDSAAEGNENKDKNKRSDTERKTYSEDDFATALAAEKQKWQDEQKEKDRIEKLSPEERNKAEKDNADKEIADLKQKLLQKELHEKAVATLSKDGFPVGLAELVSYQSQEEMTGSLEKVIDTFKTCLSEAVNQRLKGKTPAGLGNAAHAENATKDMIAKNIRGGF